MNDFESIRSELIEASELLEQTRDYQERQEITGRLVNLSERLQAFNRKAENTRNDIKQGSVLSKGSIPF